MRKFTRLIDVAMECGVSTATVSDVLNGKSIKKRISLKTSELVERTAKKMNYRVNLQARNMTKGHSFTIGAIFCRLDNTFYSEIYHGFHDVCVANGYSPIALVSNWDSMKEKELLEQLTKLRVEGIALSPANSSPEIKNVIDKSIPIISIEYERIKDAGFIGFDNYSGVRNAVKHLASKGKKRICIVIRDNSSFASDQRLKGYKKGLEDIGLKFNENLIYKLNEAGSHTLNYCDLGYQESRRILTEKHKPDSIIALNDEFAAGTYHAARELNLKIPENIAVIGYGGHAFSSHMSPPLTTFYQNGKKFGQKMGEKLLDRIKNNKEEPRKFLIKTPLIEGGST